jgi:tRNA(Ile)-lysidine synthase
MADVRRAVREALETLQLKPDSLLLVACSGGPDSLALASAVAFEAPRLNLRAGAVVVDHNLQQGSAEVANRAAEQCESFGLEPVVLKQVNVSQSGEGLEAAARSARYAALAEARVELGAQLVMTGHSLEDQAETVMLGLARGSGLKSISGMPTFDSERKLLRPLLGVERETLKQSLRDQGIDFWEDPHNQDPSFARVRVRNLLSTLESELGPGFVQGLSRSAEIAATADDFIAAQAAKLEKRIRVGQGSKAVSYPISELELLHPAILAQLIKLVCERAGAKGVSLVQVETISRLISDWHGQKPTQLSGITVERVKDHLVFTSKPKAGASCS